MLRRASLTSAWRVLNQIGCMGKMNKIGSVRIVVRSRNDCHGSATILSLFIIDLHVAFSSVKPSSFAMETQEKVRFALLSKRQIRVISTAVNSPEVLGLHVKCLALSSNFNRILRSATHSCRIPLYIKFSRKFVQWESLLNMLPDGQTNRRAEANRRFLLSTLTHLKSHLRFWLGKLKRNHLEDLSVDGMSK
jgi:hypothetical protein